MGAEKGRPPSCFFLCFLIGNDEGEDFHTTHCGKCCGCQVKREGRKGKGRYEAQLGALQWRPPRLQQHRWPACVLPVLTFCLVGGLPLMLSSQRRHCQDPLLAALQLAHGQGQQADVPQAKHPLNCHLGYLRVWGEEERVRLKRHLGVLCPAPRGKRQEENATRRSFGTSSPDLQRP